MVDQLILPSPIVVFLTTCSIKLFATCFFMFTHRTFTHAGLFAMTHTSAFNTFRHFVIFLDFSKVLSPAMPKSAMTNGINCSISI